VFRFNDTAKRFINDAGKFISWREVLGYSAQSAEQSAAAMARVAGALASGGPLGSFGAAFKAEIKGEYIRQYLLGIGGINRMTQADWGSIGGSLTEQYKYIPGFLEDIASGKLTEAQIAARANMYINSSREAFERAKAKCARELEMTEELWVLDGGEHCEDCLTNEGMGPQPVGTFPKPGSGATQCLCIVSPDSMVQTRRGLLPLYDVAVGDMVVTHEGRWQEVTGVVVKPATGAERVAYIHAPGRAWVACTDGHLWKTAAGWHAAPGMDTQLLMCYPVWQEDNTHENVRTVRKADAVGQGVQSVQCVPVGVRVWEGEGLARQGVYGLWPQPGSYCAMGDTAGQYSGGDSAGRQDTADSLRGPIARYHLATTRGWTALDLVLGRRQEAHDLPLSVAVDRPAWADSAGLCDTSLERRQDGRPGRESGMHAARSAFACPCSRTQLESLARASVSAVDVPDVRQGIPALGQETQGWATSCEILLGGLLAKGTPLYDLQVRGDHSFVIEGLAAHNTNCLCHLEYVSKTGETYGGD
jgi:hypothetical protein